MNNPIEYRALQMDEQPIIHLYQQNNWTSYTDHPTLLLQGIQQSLYTYAAYHNDQLVGLIRVIGDGQTIIYIQDILVLPQYRRKYIGTTLIHHVLDKYQHVRQIILTTIQQEIQQDFYESIGFVRFESLDLVGYYYKK